MVSSWVRTTSHSNLTPSPWPPQLGHATHDNWDCRCTSKKVFKDVAQRLKRLPPMRETWVRSLGREDPLKKEMVTYSSILAWRIPWMEKPGRLQSTGSQRVGHDWVTSLHFTSDSKESVCHASDLGSRSGRSLEKGIATHSSIFFFLTPILPVEFHGQRNLVGCSPWGHKDDWATNTSTFSHMIRTEIAGALLKRYLRGYDMWAES